ncbi:HNH endonuclease [Longispora sp. K20-0274]|uniref:HNH endonuclease n=1 Tax=Longispora sp. K20-0274 TaxID=3088255 RepID=UPI00399AF9A5
MTSPDSGVPTEVLSALQERFTANLAVLALAHEGGEPLAAAERRLAAAQAEADRVYREVLPRYATAPEAVTTWEKAHQRLKTPKLLVDLAYQVFGHRCLICPEDWSLEIAHIDDWKKTKASVDADVSKALKTEGALPSRHWVTLVHDRFHNLGNVVPLCTNCHTKFDHGHPDYPAERILDARARALHDREVVRELTAVLLEELAGRRSQCRHRSVTFKRGQRKRLHSIAMNVVDAARMLIWIADAYQTRVITDESRWIVPIGDRDYHLHIDLSAVDIPITCVPGRGTCDPTSRVWQPPATSDRGDRPTPTKTWTTTG